MTAPEGNSAAFKALYHDVSAPAWEQYAAATAAADQQLRTDLDAAWSAFGDSGTPDQPALEAAVSNAWAAYEAATGPAWDAFVQATAPVWAKFIAAASAERQAPQ